VDANNFVDACILSPPIFCRQIIGGDKTLAPTKYSRQQNIGVNKIFSSTKYSRQQNLGVDKILAHARKHHLTVLAQAEYAAADFS
jgi:hypothetical protein